MSGLEVVRLEVHVIKVRCMYVCYTVHTMAGLQKITEGSEQTSHSLSGFIVLDVDLSNLVIGRRDAVIKIFAGRGWTNSMHRSLQIAVNRNRPQPDLQS